MDTIKTAGKKIDIKLPDDQIKALIDAGEKAKRRVIKIEVTGEDVSDNVFLVTEYIDNEWRTHIEKDEERIGYVQKTFEAMWKENAHRDIELRGYLGMAAGISNTRRRKELLMETVAKFTKEHFKIEHITKKEEKKEMAAFEYISSVTYPDVMKTIRKYLYVKDEGPILVTIAVALSNKLAGDPVWLLLIAPPGGSKSEIIRAFSANGKINDFVHPISTLTPSTFVSGLPENEDLLPRIDGKIITLKDFTTILTKQPDARNEILGQLREIYDGHFSKETGSGVGTKYYDSKITVIAGVTPVIDNFAGVQSLLGERFLRIRTHEDEDIDANQALRESMAMAAYNGEGLEEEMRINISNRVLSLYKDFSPDKIPTIAKNLAFFIVDCAEISSVLRTGVDRDITHNIKSVPEPEFSTRLSKQYKKIAMVIAWMLGKQKVDFQSISYVYRIALDTIEKKRILILKSLNWTGLTTKEISDLTLLPSNTVREVLEDLWILGICSRYQEADEQGNIPQKSPYVWAYSHESRIISKINKLETHLDALRSTEKEEQKRKTSKDSEHFSSYYNINIGEIPGRQKRIKLFKIPFNKGYDILFI